MGEFQSKPKSSRVLGLVFTVPVRPESFLQAISSRLGFVAWCRLDMLVVSVILVSGSLDHGIFVYIRVGGPYCGIWRCIMGQSDKVTPQN